MNDNPVLESQLPVLSKLFDQIHGQDN